MDCQRMLGFKLLFVPSCDVQHHRLDVLVGLMHLLFYLGSAAETNCEFTGINDCLCLSPSHECVIRLYDRFDLIIWLGIVSAGPERLRCGMACIRHSTFYSLGLPQMPRLPCWDRPASAGLWPKTPVTTLSRQESLGAFCRAEAANV